MKSFLRFMVGSLGIGLVGAFLGGSTVAQAQTYTPLYNLGSTAGDPMSPIPFSALAQGRDGRLHSTTSFGGSAHQGAAYAVTTGGSLVVLYNFPAYPSATSPLSGLTLGTDGLFYGSTSAGGAHIDGGVFKMTDAGAYTNLWDFTGNADEGVPEAPLVLGADGNLYATTEGVYTGTYGTAFKITPKGALKTLHAFKFTDGATPYAILLGLDGNFYGVTRLGGANNMGVVFKMTLAGAVTNLHSFIVGEGSGPLSPLIQATDGNFYGTTRAGGAVPPDLNLGTVFKMTPAGVVTILHSFTGDTADAAIVHAVRQTHHLPAGRPQHASRRADVV